MTDHSSALWIVVHDVDLACDELASYRRQLGDYGELWVEHPEYPRVGALFSGPRGWMMYLRFDGDAGFSTRGPRVQDQPDQPMRFVLSNGQVDEYPASWTYSRAVIFGALEQFIRTRTLPDLAWHNDSGDGAQFP